MKELNGRKLTNYLNKQVDKPSNWMSHFSSDETKAAKEVSYAINALKAMNLKEKFLEHMNDYGWRPQLVNARHFYYMNYLVSKFPKVTKKPLRVLEIGGGSGTLSLFLRAHTDIVEYVDVDFPEMCLVNYFEHQRYAERNNASFTYSFFNADDKVNLGFGSTSGQTISYIEPACFFANKKRFNRFDLIINTHSLQEMDRDVRNAYLLACSSMLKPDGLFFHVNWEQRKMTNRDGSLYHNTPMTYPYPAWVKRTVFIEDPIGRKMRLMYNYKKKTLGFLSVIEPQKNFLINNLAAYLFSGRSTRRI